MEKKKESLYKLFRWMPLSWTSPSGKAMFVCICCGRHSATPDKQCPPVDGMECHCQDFPNHERHYMSRYGLDRILDRAFEKNLLGSSEYLEELERMTEWLRGRLQDISHDADEASQCEYAPEQENG